MDGPVRVSMAVQAALEEIGAPYERIWVGREADDVARFRTMNPTGRVPALALPDGTVLFESAALLIHLALSHPTSGLAPPPGGSRHAAFLQWMVFLSATSTSRRFAFSIRSAIRPGARRMPP